MLQQLKHSLRLVACLSFVTVAHATATENVSAQLRLQDSQSQKITQAVLLNASADINANAIATEVTLTQTFANRSANWVEGMYVFPLPENAAVDKMTMQIGDKKIIGKIREKKQAKALYKAAVNNGQKAALLDMSRDNLFTATAGNIPPQGEITVTLHYVQPTHYQDGAFSLTVPTTYTPRYIVKNTLVNEPEPASNPATKPANNNALPSQTFSRNSPNRLKVNVQIEAGRTITHFGSRSHNLPHTISQQGQTATVTADNIEMNKDLHLRWKIADSNEPLALAFSEKTTQGYFTSVLFMPPQSLLAKPTNTTARETVFIIDTSGSMSGDAIRQAKSGALAALRYLTPNDSFNLFEFNSQYSQLFPTAQLATAENIALAETFINGLDAGGGTEMYAPLAAALNTTANNERLRQIVFLTDGAVGNESQLFQLIQQNLGKSRLFTVGIGAAPNAYFMQQAATFGRGTNTNINQISEVSEKISTLFEQLQYPTLTDIEVTMPKSLVDEIYPTPIPDLYRGYPVVAHIKTKTAPKDGDIVIKGNSTNTDSSKTAWEYALNITTATENNSNPVGVLSKLWARKKINHLNHQAIIQGDDTAFDDELLTLGLDYQLLTKRTAFVAIEEKISRDTLNDPLQKKNIPNAMPAGNTMSFPTTATSSTLTALLGSLLLIIAVWLALVERYRRDFSSDVEVDNVSY